MITIRIEASRCPQNHACLAIDICPAGAISQMDASSIPDINGDTCAACGICTMVCGYGAILKN